MDNALRFDYYYGMEAEQHSFYRVPRLLVKDKRFKKLSSDAKLLYGLMLDRMSLSVKNGWFDEERRAYIYYTVENIMEDLGCSKPTCSKIIAELDDKKGIGLIERKKQGLGKPDMIYVKNFVLTEDEADPEDDKKSPKNTASSSEVKKFDFQRLNNFTSGGKESEPVEVKKVNPNYNNTNYTDLSYNNSIYPSERRDRIDGMDDADTYIKIIKENIEYTHFMGQRGYRDKDLFEELFELICEIVCVKRRTVRIDGVDYPYELVKTKFLKLNGDHLLYVIECMKKNTAKIINLKAYMITALYNAPTTINHYYQQEVQYDLNGGGFYETNGM